MNKIIVYSTTTCPYCKQLKDYLSLKNIKFTEKLVDMDEIAQKEMAEVSGGFLGVPFTTFIDETGRAQTVLGFDKGKIDLLIQ